MAKPKLYVVDHRGYARPFERTLKVVDSLKQADVMMFTGGADILPSHYGEKSGPSTYCSPSRDRGEIECYNVAISRNIPIIGICRGAQLLCALSGGKLVQDVTGHGRGHTVETDDGQVLAMSSLHHQMMRPEGTDHKLIAWSSHISRHYKGQDGEELYGQEGLEKEPDIVYFAKNRGLGFQGHPEMMPDNHPTVDYCNRLVKKYLLGETVDLKLDKYKVALDNSVA